MSGVLVAVSRLLFNVLYKAFDALPRRNEVLFFSRQSNEPSRDFMALGAEFEKRGFTAVYLTKKLSKRTVLSYTGHIVRELYHLARCKACFLDRYDPVVCLLDFRCEKNDPLQGVEREMYEEFPCEPIVIQLWHAFGAFKKFGYQSVDTVEGHPTATADRFMIHRNYSYVLCSGEGCIQPFSEAFKCPPNRVVPLLRPEYDWLLENKRKAIDRKKPEKPVMLFAPTLRKSAISEHPLRLLHESGIWKSLAACASLVWSFHPLEETGIAPGDANEALFQADYVITDYSSIVYEAYVLGKPILFYVPDIDLYRDSPGLNIDPEVVCPGIVFKEAEELIDALQKYSTGEKPYPEKDLDRFMRGMFADSSSSATKAVVEFALKKCTEVS